MRISDWSTDVCSSDLQAGGQAVNADANAGGTASKAELRTLAQRERILCAAQKCFVEHGFHAASMASIAETAEMSAGLLYRSFQKDNAIILPTDELPLPHMAEDIRLTHQDALAHERAGT